ncbi:MAG TPA: metalloregulator ArsR/SmtB family transcription factor [Clostridia bacterium]|nr:metalloregulator ArsR/SmtB family transcription factor [Clostridia bacterium]
MRIEEIVAEYLPCENELDSLSGYFGIFSDNTRLKIISLLSVCEVCVTDISKLLRLNQTTVSHQLAVLKKAGIVDCRRNGKTIFYYIADENVENMMEMGVKHSKD